MELRSSSAIVLHQQKYGEADVIITVYTDNYGKLKLSIKGIKKSKNRSLSAVEPGSIVNIVFYFKENQQIYNVKEISLIGNNIKIIEDFNKIIQLFIILEIVNKTTGFNDADLSLFKLIKGAIEKLKETNHYELLTITFILHFLKITGILPSFDYCSICNTKIKDDIIYFNNYDTKIYCSNCKSNTFQSINNFPSIVNIAMKQKFDETNFKEFNYKDIKQIYYYLLNFVENYYHIKLKSPGLL